jgi:hypothetical protein
VAHQMGFSIEETTGTLAEFAQNGLLGEKGGAALKQMFLRLANPTKKSGELMDQYGLSLYKANGQIKTLPELAGNLQKQLREPHPGPAQRRLGTIFGSRAIQAANILVKDGEKTNRRWIKSVERPGLRRPPGRRQDELAEGRRLQAQGPVRQRLHQRQRQAELPARLVQNITKLVGATTTSVTPSVQRSATSSSTAPPQRARSMG